MSTPAPAHAPQMNPTERIMQIATGYIASISLHIAAKLGIADLLKDGPRPVSDLAASTSTQADGLYRMLRALASIGVFTETAPRTFALTPVAEVLRSDAPGSMRAMATWMGDPLHLRVYSELLHSIRTAQPAIEHVFGKSAFEYLEGEKAEAEIFNAAMTSFSRSTVPAILEAYDFSAFDTLVDIGGGHGFMLTSILKKHPALKGILVELESVCPGARAAVQSQGLASRCQIASGSFFATVPAGGDAYIMKHIIHDWPDEKAVTILRNTRLALQGKSSGKVLVVDAVVAAGNEPHFAKFLDLEMMIFCGSRERTAEEFHQLFAAAGLRVTNIIPTKSPACIIEGVAA